MNRIQLLVKTQELIEILRIQGNEFLCLYQKLNYVHNFTNTMFILKCLICRLTCTELANSAPTLRPKLEDEFHFMMICPFVDEISVIHYFSLLTMTFSQFLWATPTMIVYAYINKALYIQILYSPLFNINV